MSANYMDAVVKLAAIKQLDKDLIQDIIVESITGTLAKKLEPESELEVFVEEQSGMIKARFKCLVVEVETKLGEMSLEEAKREHDRYAELGQYITKTMAMSEFEPKLVKIAQKAIQDKIRQLEEEKIQNDFNKQKNTIVTGKIKSIDDNGGYRIDIGYTDALLPTDEQIENEFYRVGAHIKAYVVNIRTQQSNVTIILSLTNPEFDQKRFEAGLLQLY